MSSNIGKFDTVYAPDSNEFKEMWHNKQTLVAGEIRLDMSNVPLVFPNIIESRFQLRDVDNGRLINDAMDEDEEKENSPLNGWKMILAEHPQGLIPLHVPKAGYQIHQNKDLADSTIQSAIKVLGADNIQIATIGTLGNLSQFFLSVSIRGMDTFTIQGKHAKYLHKMFLNLVSSHNGTTASAIMLSIVRMVCQNTVNASLDSAEKNGTANKFKHSKESLAKVTPQAFEKALKGWIAAGESYKATLQAFESQNMTADTFKAFAAGVFTNDGSDNLSTNSFNRVEDMTGLFARGRGNHGETLSDGINAFTEYFTSGNGVGSDKVSAGKKIASANFGRGNDWKRLAISIASNEDEFALACKRGEMFYADKTKEMSTKN